MATTPCDDDDSDDDINPFKSIMLLPPQEQEPIANPSLQSQNQNTQQNLLLQQNYYYLPSTKTKIFIRQIPSEGLSFQLWPAATTLVTLLDNHRSSQQQPSIPNPFSALFKTQEYSRPLRILELGSGTGLVGIAAAALLGANVTLSDLPHVLPNLRFNSEANSEAVEVNGGKVNVAAICWGEEEHMEGVERKEYDVILGSDLVYHDHLFEPLIKTLKFFLIGKCGDENKVVFIMAHLKRWKKESAFFKMARKLFDVQVLHTDLPSNGSRVGVVVYQFVGKDGVNS